METQKERIGMCVWTLKKRLGIDPKNEHYELDQDTTAITVTKHDAVEDQSRQQVARLPQAGASPEAQEEQAEGLFL
jgi:hypothetical protein